MLPSVPVTRFAPSPTGGLHLGHVRAALFARRAAGPGGRFLLRLEDIDAGRCRPEFARAIREDLLWLGLGWDGPVRVQSAHMDEYRRVLERLRALGVLYPCFCTRAAVARELAEAGGAPHHGPDGAPLYPGTCRRLSADERAARLAAGEPHALRLDVAAALARVPGPLRVHERGEGVVACRPELWGDVVLGRRDVPASYHLCVTHDDALCGVDLVTRGEDLRPATDLHRLLQVLLGWPEPAYAHHPLLHAPDGRRLSKRDGAATLAALRGRGLSPAAVLALAGG